jgi:hypothetical protein
LPDTVLCRAVGLQFGLQNLFPAHVKERALTERGWRLIRDLAVMPKNVGRLVFREVVVV